MAIPVYLNARIGRRAARAGNEQTDDGTENEAEQ
jgi:hypothetical protein